jgi:hypothetical protein
VAKPLKLSVIAMASCAVVLAAALPGPASAAPGDPPIVTKSPASGSTVAANDLGLKVEFGCPAYTKSTETKDGEDGEEIVVKEPGDADEYGVHFSTGTAIGPDGLLTTAGFGDDGEGLVDVAADKVTCSAELNLPEGPVPADLYSGTIYWQAYRNCDACEPAEYEAGPVNAMVVTPNVEEPELELEDHVFAGLLTKVSFSTFSDLSGASIVLQRWDGKRWLEMDEAPAGEGGDSDFYVKFKRPAHTAVRVVIAAPGVGIAYATEPRKLTVRDADAKRSVGYGDEGVYLPLKAERAKAPAHFKVEDDGAALVDLFARVESRCTAGLVSATTYAKVEIKRAHIAPDGSVTAELHTKGATPATITLVGDLHDRQFSGELSTSFLNCSGSRQLELDLGGLPQKSEDEAAKP